MFDNSSWNIYDMDPPWGDRPSLYRHVRAHIRPGKRDLVENGETLPDEALVRSESGLRWVSGGLDGAFGHHVGRAASVATSSRQKFGLRRTTPTQPETPNPATSHYRLH